MTLGRILHFLAGSRRFGFHMSEVREIREIAEVFPVPGAPDIIAGLTDVRGRIVTLVDLSKIFRYDSGGGDARLAVQLAEPHAHLGVMIPGRPHQLETADEAEVVWDAQGPPIEEAHVAAEPLGREIVLGGARSAYLIDVEALARFCAERVRDRFRVTA